MAKKRSGLDIELSTHLYVLRCKDKLKIGITNNIDKRIQSLQTGNPDPIVLEFVEERLNPRKAEKWLHTQFAYCRTKGEWFEGISLIDVRRKLMMFHEQD